MMMIMHPIWTNWPNSKSNKQQAAAPCTRDYMRGESCKEEASTNTAVHVRHQPAAGRQSNGMPG